MNYWWPVIIALLLEEEKKRKERTHSRYKKRFHRALGAAGRQLRQRCIPHESLLDTNASPWHKLYYSYNNQALITATGLSHHAFEYLVNKFTWYFENYTPFNGRVTKRLNMGRRRRIDAIDCLGLTLVWTCTKGSLQTFLKSSQQTEIGEGETEEEILDSIRVKRAATSMRQAAEWGMRALQSSFPRMLDRLVYEERGERRIIMKMMILLYNF
jgi:hypothetical protein